MAKLKLKKSNELHCLDVCLYLQKHWNSYLHKRIILNWNCIEIVLRINAPITKFLDQQNLLTINCLRQILIIFEFLKDLFLNVAKWWQCHLSFYLSQFYIFFIGEIYWSEKSVIGKKTVLIHLNRNWSIIKQVLLGVDP